MVSWFVDGECGNQHESPIIGVLSFEVVRVAKMLTCSGVIAGKGFASKAFRRMSHRCFQSWKIIASWFQVALTRSYKLIQLNTILLCIGARKLKIQQTLSWAKVIYCKFLKDSCISADGSGRQKPVKVLVMAWRVAKSAVLPGCVSKQLHLSSTFFTQKCLKRRWCCPNMPQHMPNEPKWSIPDRKW